MPPSRPDSVWVHVATSQEVVELGLQTMLERAAAPFEIVLAGPPEGEPDVVLFDVILMQEGDTSDLDRWLADTATTVIALDRTLRPELGAQARARGVEWGITLGISPTELVQVIEESMAGSLEGSAVVDEWTTSDFLGQDEGLSPRESEILAAIVQGLSNTDIAASKFLSVNSVKSYIRSAYHKLGVTSRSQAVAWGIQHGFAASVAGVVDDDLSSR